MDIAVIVCIVLLVLSFFLAFQWYKSWRFKSMNCRIAEYVFRNVDAYVLLIDKDFNVLKTNYYIQTNKPKETTLPKIGNLLRCRNGMDAGQCGTHELCASCPLRQVITEGFRDQRDFHRLHTSLKVYAPGNQQVTSQCDVSVTGSYINLPKGQEQMLLTIHDITDIQRIQRELDRTQARAEESDRMKTLFLANTGHEFRTPLNAITGFSELLAGDPTAEEKHAYMAIIRENNEVLLQLVNDILDLSKIEAGTLEFEFSDEELNLIMEELEDSFRRRLKNSNVKLRFERKYDTCCVRADRKRFSQVMYNFLSNAVKFTENGEIVFGYELRKGELYFYVKDTGVGIPEDQLQYMFKRFAKIGSHKQGVGIGLAICKCIVTSIGGRIGVESQQGKGSTFWFTVPEQQMFDPQ